MRRIQVKLGGVNYNIDQLPITPNHRWRMQIFEGKLKEALETLGGIGRLDTTNTTELGELFDKIKSILLKLSPEELLDMSLEYLRLNPKYATGDLRQEYGLSDPPEQHPLLEIGDKVLLVAYDEELIDLLVAVVRLAVPLERLTKLIPGLPALTIQRN